LRKLKHKAKKRPRENQRLPAKTRPRNASSELTIEIGLSSSRLAETIFKSLLPETKQPTGFRSQVSVKQTGETLELHILADDIVALRAASNTFLRFVAVAVKTVNVVAPFYRKVNLD
jgi:tRNA threonylcarbamoyladenosine modification (KEOPS) complex  Pcc1 subunit